MCLVCEWFTPFIWNPYSVLGVWVVYTIFQYFQVDGAIACAFVDLLRGSGIFSRAEADQYIAIGWYFQYLVIGVFIGDNLRMLLYSIY